MYCNTLIQLKNADRAGKDSFTAAFSKFDFDIFSVLKEKGFVKDVQKRPAGKKSFLEVKLAKHESGPRIQGLKLVSKPGRRIYVGAKELKPVRQGYGIAVVSTPKGVMAASDARRAKVGGEYLFQIW